MKSNLDWIELVDPFEGGLRCKRCGKVDMTLKFPISPGLKEKHIKEFENKHKDCKEAGNVTQ